MSMSTRAAVNKTQAEPRVWGSRIFAGWPSGDAELAHEMPLVHALVACALHRSHSIHPCPTRGLASTRGLLLAGETALALAPEKEVGFEAEGAPLQEL